MGMSAAPVPKRWNLNGVPVYQAEVPGRVRAALEFRVGTADEPLHMSGITHLIEHLALSGLGTQTYDYNGFVDQTHCAFLVSGTADDVRDFFAHVCGALRSLPKDRVATERRVIETEASGHHQSSFRSSLSYRFGASGFGTGDYRQIGMLWLTPDAVQDWANRHFTAGNAAAWVAGPVIPGLKIDLPAGPRLPPPPFAPKQFITPCVVEDSSQGATISMVGERSAALAAGLLILERRAMQRIRFNEGLSYGVQATLQELDGHMVHALASTDAMADHVQKAGSALLDVADVLSLSGPDAAELQFVASTMDEAMSDPQSVVGDMQGMVAALLLGREPKSPAERRAELTALDARSVATALKAALDTAIVIIPTGTQSPRPHFAPYPTMAARPLQGTESPSVYGTGERIVVGPIGISLCDSDRRALNIPWKEIAVGARWEDGSRLLIGRDGSEILFQPPMWPHAQLILGAIEGNAPPDRMISADTPSPSADLPPPPRMPKRARSVFTARAPIVIAVAGFIVAVLAAVALIATTQSH